MATAECGMTADLQDNLYNCASSSAVLSVDGSNERWSVDAGMCRLPFMTAVVVELRLVLMQTVPQRLRFIEQQSIVHVVRDVWVGVVGFHNGVVFLKQVNNIE